MVADYTTGMIAFYKFNGNILDSSGNGNDLTSSGSITYVNDEFGSASSAINFDTSNYVTTPSLNLGTSWSFVIRVYDKLSGGGNTYIAANSGSDYFLCGYNIVTTAKVEGYSSISGNNVFTIENSAISASTWTQYVVTCDGSNMKLFKDGVQQGTNQAISSSNMPAWQFRFGAGIGGASGNPLDGYMSHAIIYNNRALDTDTISGLNTYGDAFPTAVADDSGAFGGGL